MQKRCSGQGGCDEPPERNRSMGAAQECLRRAQHVFGGEGGIVRVSPYANPRIPRLSLRFALGTAVCSATASCAALATRSGRWSNQGVLTLSLLTGRALDRRVYLAEREGFEPPLGCPKPNFESGAFDHSAISPEGKLYRVCQG